MYFCNRHDDSVEFVVVGGMIQDERLEINGSPAKTFHACLNLSVDRCRQAGRDTEKAWSSTEVVMRFFPKHPFVLLCDSPCPSVLFF